MFEVSTGSFVSILTQPEQDELARPRILATAETISGFGGLLLSAGVDMPTVISATAALREQIGRLPTDRILLIAGHLQAVTGYLDVAVRHQPPTPIVAVEAVDTTLLGDSISVRQDTSNANEPALPGIEAVESESAVVPSILDGIPLIQKESEGMIGTGGTTPSTRWKSEKQTAGLLELTRIFKNILDESQLVHLQQLDEDARKTFLDLMAEMYRRNSSKPIFAERQIARIDLFIQGQSRTEAAKALGQSVGAIEQSLRNLQKIFFCQRNVIRSAITAFPLDQSPPRPLDGSFRAEASSQYITDASPRSSENTLPHSPDVEPPYVALAERMITLLGLSDEYLRECQGLLSPESRGDISQAKVNVLSAMQNLVITKYNGLPAKEFSLTVNEQMVLRKLLGIFNRGGQLVRREPMELAAIIKNLSANPHAQKDVTASLYSGLAKILSTAEGRAEGEVQPPENLLSGGILMDAYANSNYDREAWLEAAKTTVMELADALSMSHGQAVAFWSRSHKDPDEEYKELTLSTKQALLHLQNSAIHMGAKLFEEIPLAAPAFRMFIATALGGPRNIEEIDDRLSQNSLTSLPETAERYILAVMHTMLQYMQAEKLRKKS